MWNDRALASRRSKPNLEMASFAHSRPLDRHSSASAALSRDERDCGQTIFCLHFAHATYGRPLGSIIVIEASPPPEQLLDIAQLQFHISRAAVVALAGIRRVFHLAQQRVHLFRFEAAAGADRAVAGH